MNAGVECPRENETDGGQRCSEVGHPPRTPGVWPGLWCLGSCARRFKRRAHHTIALLNRNALCRTYGAGCRHLSRSQPFRAGLTSDAPTALGGGETGTVRRGGRPYQRARLTRLTQSLAESQCKKEVATKETAGAGAQTGVPAPLKQHRRE